MHGLSTALVAVSCVLLMMLAGHLWLSRAAGRGLAAALFGGLGLQAGLLLVQLLDPFLLPPGLRPVVAAGVPPLLYLALSRGVGRDSGVVTRRDSLHALPLAWVTFLVLWPDAGSLIDLSLVVIDIGYALALLSVDRSGQAGGLSRRGALRMAAALLAAVALLDLAIGLELAAGGSLGASLALRAGIALMLGATLVLFAWAWRDPEWFRHSSDFAAGAAHGVPAPGLAGEGDPVVAQALCERLDAMLSDSRVYAEFGLSLASVAKRLGVPPRQLSDAVNRVHARGFRTLINDRKVSEAARLLADEAMASRPVIDIMFDAGFQTKSSFNKEFVARKGMTPSEYRRSR